MGRRGPMPERLDILRARGSRRATQRDAESEQGLAIEIPLCPTWLDKEGKAEWDRQIDNLTSLGTLRICDGPLIAAYCEAASEFIQLKARIDKAGFARSQSCGFLKARNQAVARMLKLAPLIGCGPLARQRWRTQAPLVPEKLNPKLRFFENRN
jgi:P27 family predicted phage terminase small subunit